MRRLPILGVLLLGTASAGAADSAIDPATLFSDDCAGCHGAAPEPLSGSPYPALFGNPRIAAAGAAYVALKALQGSGNMFPLCALASDAEIAAIANHLAAANGHPGPPLTPASVAELRPASGDCPVSP